MQIRSAVVQTIVNINYVQTGRINSFFLVCVFLFHFEKQIASTRRVPIQSDDIELTCNNLFITYYMLQKNQPTKLKYKKALIKLQSNSRHQI